MYPQYVHQFNHNLSSIYPKCISKCISQCIPNVSSMYPKCIPKILLKIELKWYSLYAEAERVEMRTWFCSIFPSRLEHFARNLPSSTEDWMRPYRHSLVLYWSLGNRGSLRCPKKNQRVIEKRSWKLENCKWFRRWRTLLMIKYSNGEKAFSKRCHNLVRYADKSLPGYQGNQPTSSQK